MQKLSSVIYFPKWTFPPILTIVLMFFDIKSPNSIQSSFGYSLIPICGLLFSQKRETYIISFLTGGLIFLIPCYFKDEAVNSFEIINRIISSFSLLVIAFLVTQLIEARKKQNSHSKKLNSTVGEIEVTHSIKSRFFQLMLNLIGNTIKYSEKKEIEIKYKTVNEFHTFQSIDNDMGIEKKYHEKIFELFQGLNINKEIDITGIGLSVCNKITEELGGKLTVDSIFGKGSTFKFNLPNNPI